MENIGDPLSLIARPAVQAIVFPDVVDAIFNKDPYKFETGFIKGCRHLRAEADTTHRLSFISRLHRMDPLLVDLDDAQWRALLEQEFKRKEQFCLDAVVSLRRLAGEWAETTAGVKRQHDLGLGRGHNDPNGFLTHWALHQMPTKELERMWANKIGTT